MRIESIKAVAFRAASLAGSIFLSLIAPSALAQGSVIDFDQLTYAGNGCAKDSAPIEVKYSEANERAVFIFPEMKLDLSNGRLERKSCSLALPVQVPAGKKLVIGSPSLFGETNLAEETSVDFRGEAFLAGQNGPLVTRTADGSIQGRRYFYERLYDEVESSCGESVIVRLNLSMIGRSKDSSINSASLDGSGLNLRLVDCEVP